MASYKAMAPGVEVNGETVLSVVNGMGMFKARATEALAGAGIKNPAAGNWYPQQAWLDAFKALAGTVGATTLNMIGRAIPQSARFPPEIDSIDKALAAIEVAYHMNHRGGEIGHYRFERTGGQAAKLVCNNPYPCPFDRGIVEAMASRFRPAGSTPVVKHDDSAPCREKGADSCTYLVSW
jgi:hypothetical protein